MFFLTKSAVSALPSITTVSIGTVTFPSSNSNISAVSSQIACVPNAETNMVVKRERTNGIYMGN